MNQKNINKLIKQNTLNVADGPQNCINILEGQSNLLAGGSIASNLVNQLSPKDACTLLPNSVTDVLTKDFIVANYGSNFKTTGGGENFSTNFIQNIVKNIHNNLTTDKILETMRSDWNKKNKNRLTNKNSKIILNDLLISNPPLQKKNNKKNTGGGRTVLPLKWFKPDYNYPYTPENTDMKGLNCPCPRTMPQAYNNINYYPYHRNSCTMNMKGGDAVVPSSFDRKWRNLPWDQDTNITGYRVDGDSSMFGANIPRTPMQRLGNHLNGTDPIFAPNQSDVTVVDNSNMFCDKNNCSPDQGFSGKMANPTVCVKNFDSSILSEGPVSDVLQNSTPGNSYSGPLWSPDVFYPKGHVASSQMTIPNQRAGSRKNIKKNKKSQKSRKSRK